MHNNTRTEKEPLRVIIAASGTGGHLFPALYIAQAVLQECPNAEVRFIGSGRPLEAKIIDDAGFQRYVIPIGGIRRLGFQGGIRWGLQFPRAMKIGKEIFNEFSPQVVVGVGGYVSVLPIVLARLRGIPTWIHEAEQTPGLANRVLSLIASRVSVAYPGTIFPLKRRVEVTGHPLRPEMKEYSFQSLPREGRSPHLLILGGSQGAKSIDIGMENIASELAKRKIEVFHQCRKDSVSSLRNAYEGAGVTAVVEPFVKEMAAAYRWSDAIVTRTGAGTVREIAVTQKPTICVPLPEAIEQRENAHLLQDSRQGILIEEGEQFTTRLLAAIDTVLTPGYGENISQDSSLFDHREAAGRIARGIIQLAHPLQ